MARQRIAQGKNPLKSMTVWGLLALFLAPKLSEYGIDSTDPALQAIGTDVISLVGAAIAYFGRVRATGPLGL